MTCFHLQHHQGLSWYAAESQHFTAIHGFFLSTGGTSCEPYATLNLSFTVGDDESSVRKNRQFLKEALGIRRLVSCRQIHEDAIASIGETTSDLEVEGYDALMTNDHTIGLLIQQADCQAVLLHDPQQKAIAAIHCGWRGSVCGIIGKTVSRMRTEYGSRPEHIQALISPSLGPCCAEFINHREEFPRSLHCYRISNNHFDFWKISHDQLMEAGLQRAAIHAAGICTACSSTFFSYRRVRKTGSSITGRNGSVIALA